MMKNKKLDKKLINRLKSEGIKIKDLYGLMENGLNYKLIDKIISNYLTEINLNSISTPNLMLIMKFYKLVDEIGYKKAKEFIELQEFEDFQICKELKDIGISITSVYDLVNFPNNYNDAIDVLVSWLLKSKNPSIKEGIVRALTIKGLSKEVKSLIFSEYEKYRDFSDNYLFDSLKWALGNCIGVIADNEDVEKIINYIKDECYGNSRQRLIDFLIKDKKVDVEETLIYILSDKDDYIVEKSLKLLEKLKLTGALENIRKLDNHSSKRVQKIAKNVYQNLKLIKD